MSRRNRIKPEEANRYWLAFEEATHFKNPALLTKEEAAEKLGVHPDEISVLEAAGILPAAGKVHKKGSGKHYCLRKVVELRNDTDALDRAEDAIKLRNAQKNAKQKNRAS